MNFALKKLASYCVKNSNLPTDILNELERETHLKTLAPQMISGPLQGQMLSLLSHMIKPTTILEVGTFTGYATICLAQGLKDQGKIYTIESNRELEMIAMKYFKKAGLNDKIEYLSGDAKKLITSVPNNIDLVFIDAGKQDYQLYLDLVLPKIATNGYVLADNTLWSGKVVGNNYDNDTKTMHAFNVYIKNHPALDVVMLPLRDGLTIIRKKS